MTRHPSLAASQKGCVNASKPHPAWPYFPSVLDRVENVMDRDALCVVRQRVFLCIQGLDVTGAIIAHDVRWCPWHRVTDAVDLLHRHRLAQERDGQHGAMSPT